jgi:serine/threonine protein kinase
VQVRLKRRVALKMILAGPHAGPDHLARFRIEAEAVARLQHPNIVQIHEIGDHAGQPFFCLEYVEGGSLALRAAGKPHPAEESARLVETLAEAIHYAHQRGVIHRDLKPANILITANGTPKIGDFGLAKQLDATDQPTLTGANLGWKSWNEFAHRIRRRREDLFLPCRATSKSSASNVFRRKLGSAMAVRRNWAKTYGVTSKEAPFKHDLSGGQNGDGAGVVETQQSRDSPRLLLSCLWQGSHSRRSGPWSRTRGAEISKARNKRQAPKLNKNGMLVTWSA